MPKTNLSKTVLEHLERFVRADASSAPGWGKVKPHVERVVEIAREEHFKPARKKAAPKRTPLTIVKDKAS